MLFLRTLDLDKNLAVGKDTLQLTVTCWLKKLIKYIVSKNPDIENQVAGESQHNQKSTAGTSGIIKEGIPYYQ